MGRFWCVHLFRLILNTTYANNRPLTFFSIAGKPDNCIGVAELEIELITGRTHQIRGQFAALGCPLVGDAQVSECTTTLHYHLLKLDNISKYQTVTLDMTIQYGGAIPSSAKSKEKTEDFLYPENEKLALQCSALKFLDPLLADDNRDSSEVVSSIKLKRSDRWSSFSLETAFWSSFIQQYEEATSNLSSQHATTSIFDRSRMIESSEQAPSLFHPCTLPPKVSLSKGSNKYVIIKAIRKSASNDSLFFIKSASPEECSGPYHANVAEELLDQLENLGLKASVIGGGRIDYIETDEIAHAHVYGFSYGFGIGDHEMVAAFIEANSNIVATFDNNDGLY